MVGSLKAISLQLEDVLNEKQVLHIVREVFGSASWELVGYQLKRAADGLAGFLGDYKRLILKVKVDGSLKEIPLFIKSVPVANIPKAEFINEHKFYKREMFMFKLIEELRGFEDPNPWCTKAYIINEKQIVMPDLVTEGYAPRPSVLETFDLAHILLITASLARFHASFANYETKKIITLQQPYSILQENDHILIEATFRDSPWLRAAAKLTANVIRLFSKKFEQKDVAGLEEKIAELYIMSCTEVKEHKNSLNVLIHKDLWSNNVMFKYKDGEPIQALIIDFQCVRYAPPVFDLMIMWYLNTSRSFREEHEEVFLRHYYTIFEDSLEDCTKRRLKELNYCYESFLQWMDKGRMFGILMAATIYPYVLMDPITAQRTFDDPETYHRYTYVDRTEPVVAYSHECDVYRKRILEVSEEFVDKYVLEL